jgi:hypothetical protein
MCCSACGREVPDDARFCRGCGAPVGRPEGAPVPAPARKPIPTPPDGSPASTGGQVPPAPPAGWPGDSPRAPGGRAGNGDLEGTSSPGPGGGHRGLWIALAAAAVVVIAVAIAVPLVLARGSHEEVSVTPTAPTTSTTTTTDGSTSTTAPETPSTSTSVTAKPRPPGDSAGEWVETDVPGAPAQVVAVAVSEEVLLMQTSTGSGLGLYAYKFGSGQMLELPVEAQDSGGADVDGFTAVWWEGTWDDASSSYTEQHIYSYDLVEGRKNEVVGAGMNVGYPQIAGTWVTWIEGSPWEADPEEYWLVPIYGSLVSPASGAAAEPLQLVPSALAAVLGDSTWTYSLGEDFLAWEQAAAVGGLDTGTYVIDLATTPAEPRSIGPDAWRPSVSGDSLVYWQNGLRYLDLKTGEAGEIDPKGDFPTAAPTFAAYFRSVDTGDGATSYEIVARGFTDGYEQVLGLQNDAPPWLSPPIAVSTTRVAFVANGALHVFQWKGR